MDIFVELPTRYLTDFKIGCAITAAFISIIWVLYLRVKILPYLEETSYRIQRTLTLNEYYGFHHIKAHRTLRRRVSSQTKYRNFRPGRYAKRYITKHRFEYVSLYRKIYENRLNYTVYKDHINSLQQYIYPRRYRPKYVPYFVTRLLERHLFYSAITKPALTLALKVQVTYQHDKQTLHKEQTFKTKTIIKVLRKVVPENTFDISKMPKAKPEQMIVTPETVRFVKPKTDRQKTQILVRGRAKTKAVPNIDVSQNTHTIKQNVIYQTFSSGPSKDLIQKASDIGIKAANAAINHFSDNIPPDPPVQRIHSLPRSDLSATTDASALS